MWETPFEFSIIPGYQKHHIIPKSMKHAMLKRLDFDVHQHKNIIQLPESADVNPNMTVHKGRHNKQYDIGIRKELDAIEAVDVTDNIKRKHVNDLMDDYRGKLATKQIKLNCH